MLTTYLEKLFQDTQLVMCLEVEYFDTIQDMRKNHYSDKQIADTIKAEEEYKQTQLAFGREVSYIH